MGFSSWLINSHVEDIGRNPCYLEIPFSLKKEGEMAQEFWMEQQMGWLVSEHNTAISYKSSLFLVAIY